MNGMHCNMSVDDERIALNQWQSEGSQELFTPADFSIPQQTPCNAESADPAPWSLTTANNGNVGLHIHYEKSSKHYARCTIERKFGDDIKLGHDTELGGNQDYLVYSGHNVYNAEGQLVDRRTSGMQRIKVQMESGATMGALASLTGIAAVAALLTF